MSNIKQAEALIQKGIDTNDMELIKQGKALLAKAPKTTKKKPVSRKKKLTKEVPQPTLSTEPVLPNPVDFSFQTRDRSKNKATAREDGKRAPKVQHVDLATIGKQNEFTDDGRTVERSDDLIKYLPEGSPRSRRPNSIVVACVKCKQEREVSVGLIREGVYECDKCIAGRGRQSEESMLSRRY